MNEISSYEILGIKPDSSETDIKKAFRRMSLKYHPDKFNGCDTKFKEIVNAYESLTKSSSDQDIVLCNKPDKPPKPILIEKPLSIKIDLCVSMENVVYGASLPVQIKRLILENNESIAESEIVYVSIPKGIDNGEIIVLQGKGDYYKGDVKVFVSVENTSDFKRVGLDLFYEKTISLRDALCGFDFKVNHPNGKTYTIQNENNVITPGYKKIIRKMGLTRGNDIGDMIIVFNVRFPDKISDSQREFLLDIF
tara:strand:+ start:34 stop:786 length:753 start_codon:yes stop_codon:yes gene_type:complete